jgi:hypothetical protein
VAENAFLEAVAAYLNDAGLTPAPTAIGVVEPGAADELPIVVLSLETTARSGNGLGQRAALITDGALPVQASIDLANPRLPEEPTFSLLDTTRTVLTLPHGGLVRRDGSSGPLTGDDLTVVVAGVPRPVVAGAPAGNQVSADPLVGQLTFATPLPATGFVVASYVLGQWEQRLTRITGTLRADACAGAAADAGTLGGQVVDALLAPEARTAIRRLQAIALTALSSVSAVAEPVALRRRSARFAFTFEHELNRPESSGGLILRVPLITTP